MPKKTQVGSNKDLLKSVQLSSSRWWISSNNFIDCRKSLKECIFTHFIIYLLVLPYHINHILLYPLSIKYHPCLLCDISDPLDSLFHYPRLLVNSYTALLPKRLLYIYTSLFSFFFTLFLNLSWLYEIISEVKKTDNGRISFKTNLIIVMSVL